MIKCEDGGGGSEFRLPISAARPRMYSADRPTDRIANEYLWRNNRIRDTSGKVLCLKHTFVHILLYYYYSSLYYIIATVFGHWSLLS